MRGSGSWERISVKYEGQDLASGREAEACRRRERKRERQKEGQMEGREGKTGGPPGV